MTGDHVGPGETEACDVGESWTEQYVSKSNTDISHRSSAVPARAVVSPRSASSSWTTLRDPSSVTSRAPSVSTTFSLSSSRSVRLGEFRHCGYCQHEDLSGNGSWEKGGKGRWCRHRRGWDAVGSTGGRRQRSVSAETDRGIRDQGQATAIVIWSSRERQRHARARGTRLRLGMLAAQL